MRNHLVALGLGSNLNFPLLNLREALARIRKNANFSVLNVSPIYESDAQLPANADQSWNKNFLNAVVLCSSELSPLELLVEIKNVEKDMGRASSETWAPRLIDIDVLYWSGGVFSSASIVLPHTRLAERPFALLPLLDVWPDAQLERPEWTSAFYDRLPFNTHKSTRYFWPEFVGILNLTEDSFSDGGKYGDSEVLLAQVEKLVNDGATILDLGAESTRPGATKVSPEEEYKKLHHALTEISRSGFNKQISVDCRSPEVVAKVLEKHSPDYLNDVGGFSNEAMKQLLKQSGKRAFVMHSLSVPPRKELTLALDENPCAQLAAWWKTRADELQSYGIAEDKLCFDPGIGFGKTRKQNYFILENLALLNELGVPFMIGHSRKSFLSNVAERPASARDLETALITAKLNLAFVQYLRVHDVQSQIVALS